ncbi:hypothetical protein AAHA92_27946 [Salvia divinorum]|uniref:Uncharacterized protein n=1 Tax=Salvia divinorum TaxID=28513 RepID=A0ABD1G8H0_SALDI
MENGVMRKEMKVEIPEMRAPPPLARTKSITCLCSPTTHAGSFRCRLHRSPTLRRSKSIAYGDSKSRAETTSFVSLQSNAVDAQ